MTLTYTQDNVWVDKSKYDDAEVKFYERKYKAVPALGYLATQIARAREEIQNSLASGNTIPKAAVATANVTVSPDVINRIKKLEDENSNLKKSVSNLEKTVYALTSRITVLESAKPSVVVAPSPVKKAVPTPPTSKESAKPAKVEDSEDDDDVDLFGSDDEDEDAEAARVREERLKQYAEKKSKKPGPIAKSSVLLDCKPWDDETDLNEMEKVVRSIEMDGLLWGAAKFVPLAFGIKKLSILCTVEDEKVSIDDLIEKIQEFEDYVQSVDIAAFNKI